MNSLLVFLWQGSVIAIVTTLAVQAVSPAAASKRHAIWWVALALTVSLPVVDMCLSSPSQPVEILSAAPSRPSGITIPMPPGWLIAAALGLWTSAAVLHVCRFVLAAQRLRRLVASSSPLDPDRVSRFSRWQARQRPGRSAEVRVSHDIAGACAAGFHRPTIIVAASLTTMLDDETLESIILHEHAHLQRYDDFGRAVQWAVVGLAKWHPGVWWISRQLDIEREIACDQHVVATTGAPLAYARGLVEVAEAIARTRGGIPALAPGYWTKPALLRLRIERLLGRPSGGSRKLATFTSAAIAMSIAAIAVWLSGVSHLVTFAAQMARAVTLVSRPLAATVPHRLPFAAAAHAPAAALDGRAAVASVPDTLDSTVRPSRSTVDVTVSPAAVDQNSAVATSTPTITAEHLLSTAIPFQARAPAVESGMTDSADEVDWRAFGRGAAATGIAVARAGTATGLAASRAGTSMSRFFKNGGLAIARSF